MKLGDATIRIAEVFGGEKQYQIPFYQRRYVWDNANWKPLWEDIIQLPDNHFAGTIVTYKQETGAVEIVDGQQRLTTFQIIFCVIRDLHDFFPLPDRKKHEITCYIVQDVEDPQNEPPRIVPTKRDKEKFQSVFSGELWKELKRQNIEQCLEVFESLQNEDNHPIITAYGFFGSKIITYLNSCENANEKFEKLADILKSFSVIHAELDSESGYDPEEIFQIINDTGRMLDDFDYLRNYLFLRTRKHFTNLDKLYNDHWDKFEDWDSVKLNLFFKAFLMAKLGPTCFEGEDKGIQPFDCYRKYMKTVEGQDQDLVPLLQLSNYADSYEKLNRPTSVAIDSDLRKLGNRMRFYDDLKLPRLDWFLLFMKHASELSDTVLNELCDILESYIVRKWLCSHNYEDSYKSNYEDSYKSIKTFCSEQLNKKPTVQEFVDYLAKQWPYPDKVKEVLKEDADSVADNLILYILYRIEPWSSSTDSNLLFNFRDEKKNKLVEKADVYYNLLDKVDSGKSRASSVSTFC